MSKTVLEQTREIRQHYRETAESITYKSSDNHAPGYGACIYQKGPSAFVATVGETWIPTTFDAACLINQYRKTFTSREDARFWCDMIATAHGYPIQTARPEYDLFTA